MQQISFQGNFLKPVTIKKLNINGEYIPTKANFIELDNDDANILKEVAQNWKKSKKCIISGIENKMLDTPALMNEKRRRFLPLSKGIQEKDIPMFLSSKILGRHVYCVTLQENNFTKIDPKKILGLVDFQANEHLNEVTRLQTDPDYVSAKYGNNYLYFFKQVFRRIFGIKDNSPKRQYSGIGHAIISTLQEAYNTKGMVLSPVNAAKGFYRKNGFHASSTTFEYFWYPRTTRK